MNNEEEINKLKEEIRQTAQDKVKTADELSAEVERKEWLKAIEKFWFDIGEGRVENKAWAEELHNEYHNGVKDGTFLDSIDFACFKLKLPDKNKPQRFRDSMQLKHERETRQKIITLMSSRR